MKPFWHEGQVVADGETLTLVCDFYAIDVIESLTEQKMDNILPQMVAPPHSLAVKVLWGLLRRKHEGVTLDEAAGALLGPECITVSAAMGDLLRRAFNIGEEPEAKDKNPTKRRGRSQSSGKNG
jgi:hypothetical protein